MVVEGSRQADAPEVRPKDGQVGDGFDVEQAGFGVVHPVK